MIVQIEFDLLNRHIRSPECFELPKYGSGDGPFQASFYFSVAQSLWGSSLDVGLGFLIESHPVLGNDVQGHVQLSVASAVKPVPFGVPGGRLEW